MEIDWQKGFDQRVLLTKIASITTVRDGKASFVGFDIKEYFAILHSMINFEGRIAPEVKSRLITQGIFDAFAKPNVAPKDVVFAIRRHAKKYIATPNVRFVLVTTINVPTSQAIPSVVSRGCRILFSNRLPSAFESSRNSVIADISWLRPAGATFQTKVRISVTAKSAGEAGSAALDSVDLLRGVWNLYLNLGWRMSFGGRRKPVNQVVLGPIHTIHHEDGTTVPNIFWYEPNHFSEHGSVDLSMSSPTVLKLAAQTRQKLSKNAYRAAIEEAIMRYVRSLDTDDHQASFIKLWSVLEFVTDTGLDSYDKTVRRASFMMQETAYHRLVLEHLRRYRNRSVHAGQFNDDVETELYQLKRYVEHVIRFHIGNSFKFTTIEEACAFMDLSPDAKALEKQIALRRAGIRFIGH